MLSNASKILALLIIALSVTLQAGQTHVKGRTHYRAPKAQVAPTVDGVANESVWKAAKWQELRHKWLGPDYSDEDFQGRYKLVWTEAKIYFLGEFVDDILYDAHRDPFVQYWDDDTLEIFIDEDYSGGEHHFNHNAFAYHIALDNQSIDIGTDKKPHFYSHHVQSQWKQSGNKIIWELAIDIYDDSYDDNADDNRPVVLTLGKIMGILVAYCDNDGSPLRENFVGSETVPGGKKDRGYKDAGIFGALELVER